MTTTKNEAVPAATGQAPTKTIKSTLTPSGADVKIIHPPSIHGVKDKDLVKLVNHAGFRGFNKSLMSHCRNPERSGICLQPLAVEAIYEKHPASRPEPAGSRRRRKSDGHRFTRRAECRLPDDVADRLQLYVGPGREYKTVSELVYSLITEFLARNEHQPELVSER